MAKLEWGTKRICQSCGAKFYDMRRSPVVCPSCGSKFDVEALLRSRRAKAPTVAKAQEETVVKDEEAVEEEGGEEDVVEDAADLDGDDLADVEVDDETKD